VILDHTYCFNIDNVSFGNLPKETVIDLFRDGRISSAFLEEHIPLWYPKLKRVIGNKDHDHIGKDGRYYDAKNFTKNGLKFCPSSQIGAGRKINKEKAAESANKLIYILCDIVEFPSIRIVFKNGVLLMKHYPSFTIPYKDRSNIFGENPQPTKKPC